MALTISQNRKLLTFSEFTNFNEEFMKFYKKKDYDIFEHFLKEIFTIIFIFILLDILRF